MSKQVNSAPTEENSTWHLWAITGIAVFFILLAFLSYFLQFDGAITSDNDKWGTFGDYIGGTLNPVLSFLALIALLYTIHTQSKELRLSRDELELTRVEMEKTSNAAQKQAKHFEREERRADTYRIIDKLASRINNNINSNRLPFNVSLYALLYQKYHLEIDGVKIKDGISELRKWHTAKNGQTLSLIGWLKSDLYRLMTYLKMYEDISERGISPSSITETLYLQVHSSLVPEFYIAEFGNVTHVLYENKMLPKDLHDYYCKTCKFADENENEE